MPSTLRKHTRRYLQLPQQEGKMKFEEFKDNTKRYIDAITKVYTLVRELDVLLGGEKRPPHVKRQLQDEIAKFQDIAADAPWTDRSYS